MPCSTPCARSRCADKEERAAPETGREHTHRPSKGAGPQEQQLADDVLHRPEVVGSPDHHGRDHGHTQNMLEIEFHFSPLEFAPREKRARGAPRRWTPRRLPRPPGTRARPVNQATRYRTPAHKLFSAVCGLKMARFFWNLRKNGA